MTTKNQTYYIANYATMDEFDAEIDDPSTAECGLEGLAAPQLAAIWPTYDEAKVAELRQQVEREAAEMVDLDCTPKFRWEVGEWITPTVGRTNITHTLLDDNNNGEIAAMLIVQKVQ